MNYELVYIIPSKIEEKEQQTIQDQVIKIITKNNGEISDKKELGKKRLSYPISGIKHGDYAVLNFDLKPDLIKSVGASLKEINHILRYLIVKKEKVLPTNRYKEKKVEGKILTVKKISPLDKSKTQKKEKTELKNLDKKLEEILEEE